VIPRQTQLLDQLRQLGPVFQSREAVDAGLAWRDLYRLRDERLIIELSRGVYQLAEKAGAGNIDFVVVCGRVPHGMICLNSALTYWDLSDEIPREIHLAVPRGSHWPTIDYPPTKVHVFHADTFDLGRIEVRLERGERFSITDRERTVVDAFRFRRRIGNDLANRALQRYLDDQWPKLARLVELARELRVTGPVMTALRILQS